MTSVASSKFQFGRLQLAPDDASRIREGFVSERTSRSGEARREVPSGVPGRAGTSQKQRARRTAHITGTTGLAHSLSSSAVIFHWHFL